MSMHTNDDRVKDGFATTAELLDWYFERHITLTSTPKTIGCTRGYIKRLKYHFGDMAPGEIGQEDVDEYKSARADGKIGKGAKPTSTATELRVLLSAINRGIAKRRLSVNDRSVFECGSGPDARPRWFTRKEAAAILRAGRKFRIRALVGRSRMTVTELFAWIALYSGHRRDAILGLRWIPQIDFARREINFQRPGVLENSKRNARQWMHPALFRALRRFYHDREDKSALELFPNHFDANYGCHELGRLAKVAGVTPHVFRHTFVTWRLAAGGEEAVFYVAKALNTTPENIYRTYAHVMPITNKRIMMATKEKRVSGGTI